MKRIIYLIMSVAAVLGLGMAAATAASASARTPAHLAAAGESTLWDGQSLAGGQSLVNGSYTFAMQTDGNLVLYYGSSQALWQSHTYGHGGAWVAMQGDGNLVVYAPGNVPLWQSGTAGNTGARLVIQTDGNAVVYTTSNRAVWQSGTAGQGQPPKPIAALPFISQYQGQATQNNDCGPASVAMVIQFYGKRPAGLSNEVFITDVRKATGNLSSDTTAPQLEKALGAYGLTFSEISNSLSPAPDAQLKVMEQAVSAGEPVIAFVSGKDLGRGTAYGDHWVVVTAFSGNGSTVYLNDPDTQSPRLPGWRPGGQISLPYSVFRSAVFDAEEGPYGIIVG